ncbi:quinone oxidoreductase family protein [Pedobacter metabolipauper]|uniref:NADPH:quinone reductase-like Zn-dependent oxidoreductase n=1 Tax=Pedobacter metabolipauper TaxID=425513 RepID=A0A4V3D0K5_9SPHI|nr:zinc-binding alcohol dehydrogenase family protein [Pedobacter metabolipauper]TDQ06225.1 NADPH:quinone reductase-like Zn-dependent oxidoreductase [Pedobacter metabolipauper]
MKAIVMFQKGGIPKYVENFPEPEINNEEQLIMTVQAAAIKHLDKSSASGTHYSTEGDLSTAKVIGGDGVGFLEDGTKVFALGITGMMAEKAVIEKSRMIILPDGIDLAVAAALPNAVAGSAMALRYRAEIKAGDTVLINGATGFTGRIAVQLARHYGAEKIIATGRNEQSLHYLLGLGVDEVISIRQDDESFVARLKEIHKATPIDAVVDYLWGHPAELILEAIKGHGNFTHRTNYVTVGSMAGDKIQLSSEILRSVDLHLTGSGMGSWTKQQMKVLISEIIPEMLQLAAEGKLKVDVQTVPIEEIEKIWEMRVEDGKRLVVSIKN